MEYVLTDHARKRIQQRGISEDWIAATLIQPARTENDGHDPTLAHALRAIPERSFKVLRVIYNETKDPVTIVTAYFDSEVKDL
jgi:hypothetical protein